MNREVVLVGHALQLELPQPWAMAVTTACVRGDEKLFGRRVARAGDRFPPGFDRAYCERRRVVVYADGDPSGVVGRKRRPTASSHLFALTLLAKKNCNRSASYYIRATRYADNIGNIVAVYIICPRIHFEPSIACA